jgi:hypothetical protein
MTHRESIYSLKCRHVLDQVLDSIVRLCIDLSPKNAPHKIVQKAVVTSQVSWEAKPPCRTPLGGSP